VARKPTGRPNGRPKKEFDKQVFEGLCSIQCTEAEIAGCFKTTTDTIDRWCKDTYGEGFSETYKKLSADGKMSLRRMQFKLAERSAAMAIFLGKQYLGQRDVPEPTAEANDLLTALSVVMRNGQSKDADLVE
jgi:hypothetical protein